MEQLMQCQVCKQGIAKFKCSKCGNMVCSGCYDKDKGMCIVCSKGVEV